LKKQATISFYFLAAYVILQFSWWAYHIVELTKVAGYEQDAINKRIGMIIGEGLVFFLILIFGLWRIIRSIKKENELAKRQSNFLLSVTHELKTPLASTKLYLQTLLKRNFDAEKREELLEKTLLENQRLEEIVEAILISTRIDNQTLEIHKEKIDLNGEIKKIIEHFKKKINADIIVLNEQKNIQLESDLFMLRTIIMNLLENAIKYAGTKEKIEIDLVQEESSVKIRIKDFGPGIPADKQKIIFQKFVRLENEETRTSKGTGLGLFIVKEFTKLCGGDINFYPNENKGSVFELVF
jgi:two-component system, OmpR family, phosphate regulon sensor histidine kinase PhoR